MSSFKNAYPTNRKAPATATGAFLNQRHYLIQKGGVTHF